MPFPSSLSSPQKTTLRTSRYWSRNLACLCPPEVVFRAQAAEAITDAPFITFNWDNADVGAYTDVWQGMIVYLSATTAIRDAFYRGRVRLAPTSTQFYIDENASLLADNTYVIVVRDTDLFARIRRDTLVDSSIPYHDLPPMTNGLPYVEVLYDADNDSEVSWTPVQTGIPVDAAATTVSIWAWDVSGAGVSSIDDDTVQNPTFTFEAGYHYLVRVTYEDDNGTENYQIIHVYAITRTFEAPVVQPVIAGSINGSLEDGWTASLTAYADVETLIDRTHCVVFHVEHFGDNSSTPIVSNVLMNGRIRSDSIQTQGSSEAGRLEQVTFAVEGITAYLRRLRIPNDIVRATDTPDEWGEITEPNPYRMAVYALGIYSTLLNLGSFGVETGAFDSWQIGAEPRGIEGGVALDVLRSLLTDTIHAAPNYAPSGEIFLAVDTNYRTDRSGVPTITTLELQDMREYTIDRDSSRTTAQVVAFGGVFDSTANTFILYTAQAPSIVYGDGGEARELTRELLIADSSITDAQIELGSRASNDYAYNNSKPILRLSLFDSYAGVMIPTNYQRWAASIAATSNTLGVAYGASDYWQLQSVTLTLNTDGSIDVSTEMPAETEFDDAQLIASLLPNNLDMNPVLPVLPNYPAYPTDPLENYPTDVPGIDDLQPIDPLSGAAAYTPFPPDVAATTAANQGSAKCKTLRINFRNSVNTVSPWFTVVAQDYLFSIQGSAQISDDGWVHSSRLRTSADEFAVVPGELGTYTAGQGFVTGLDLAAQIRELVVYRDFDAGVVNSVTIVFDAVPPPEGFDASARPMLIRGLLGGVEVFAQSTTIIYGEGITYGWSGSETIDRIEVQLTPSNLVGPGPIGGSATLYRVDFGGTGTDPFTGDPGEEVFADAFYQWGLDDEGNVINVGLLSGGLYLDNSQYAETPPYSPNSLYTNLPFPGTGNPLNARIVLDSYADVQNVYAFLEMCRKD